MGQSISAFDWQNLADFVSLTPDQAECIVLFTRNPIEDTCKLLNRNLIEIVNQFAHGDNETAFALGKGPCPQCDRPTFYRFAKSYWKSKPYTHTDKKFIIHLMACIKKYNLSYVYLLIADGDLNIKQILRAFKIEDDNFIPLKKCETSTSTVSVLEDRQVQLQQEPSSDWNFFLFLILIVIIVIVLWLILRNT